MSDLVELPIELVGGHEDGKVYASPLRMDRDGVPSDEVHIAVAPSLVDWLEDNDPQAPQPTYVELVYRRSHISDATHRWVYVYDHER